MVTTLEKMTTPPGQSVNPSSLESAVTAKRPSRARLTPSPRMKPNKGFWPQSQR